MTLRTHWTAWTACIAVSVLALAGSAYVAHSSPVTTHNDETKEPGVEVDPSQRKSEALEFTPEQNNTLIEAWMQSSLEFDKSLLAVASAGLGLIAAMTDKFQKGPHFVPFVLVLSAIAFALVICAVLAIFRVNKIYLSSVDGSRQETASSQWLKILDLLTPIVFGIAVAGTLVATSGLLLHKERPVTSSDEKLLEILRQVESGELKPTLESLNTMKAVLRQQSQSPSPSPPSSGNDKKNPPGK